jgi:hypothetical protein
MRRSVKFLHSISAIGMAGGLAAYMVVLAAAPDVVSIETHAALRGSLAQVARWLIVPSMVIVLITGLLAMIVHQAFMNQWWVLLKAVAGILIFEATLASIDAPAQQSARATAQALAGEIDAEQLAALMRDEWGAWWTLLALSAANVAVAIWRPSFRWRNR